MTMTASRLVLLLVLGLSCPSLSLSTSFARPRTAVGVSSKQLPFLRFRGGQQEEDLPTGDTDPIEDAVTAEKEAPKTTTVQQVAPLAMVSSFLSSFGASYASSLEKRPILTKSTTAGFIFLLSDFLAQRFEGSSSTTKNGSKKELNWTRLAASGVVGFCYFGPAAHAWYSMIFKLLPGTSLFSTLQKATLGQLFFGPTFTCIFFASALLQAKQFSFQAWFSKIKTDLPSVWVSGLGFWPLVDLVSYSMIAPAYIPLFVNVCSLVWTIYLSLVANRKR